MKKNIWRLMVVGIVLVMFFAEGVFAALINADSCEQADVQAAIDSAVDGDTVIIPSGTCTWSSTLTITKHLRLIGAGSANTIIYGGTNNIFMVRYAPSNPNASRRFQLSNLTLDGNDIAWLIRLYSNSITPEYVRIDHCKLQDAGGTQNRFIIKVHGTIFGVIDNNIFDQLTSSGSYDTIRFYGSESGKCLGKLQWDAFHDTIAFGTADNLYFEDNTFMSSHGNVIMHGRGGRSCIRFNDFGTVAAYTYLIDAHGNWGTCNGGSTGSYGVMMTEIYKNEVDYGGYDGNFIDLRGGMAMIWGNTVTNSNNIDEMQLREEWDDAISPEANSYIQRVHNTYFWNNRDDSKYIGAKCTGQCKDSCGYTLSENTHWWEEKSSFDGTSGVGIGTYSQMQLYEPCTDGVGFWCTDKGADWCDDSSDKCPDGVSNDGALYVCNGFGAFELYYTPYTYPHPLVTGTTTPTCSEAGGVCCDTSEGYECSSTISGTTGCGSGEVCCEESACILTYECNDGVDNDGDGDIDYGSDAGCTSESDNDETNCGDGVCEGSETCSTCEADCGACHYFLPGEYIEAEDGEITSQMQTGTDSDASGGEYVYTSEDYDGSVAFTFNIENSGQYKMEAKVNSNSDNGQDSFYVGVDDEFTELDNYYAYDTLLTDVFAWDEVNRRGNGGAVSEFDPMIWDLSSGVHTFTFYGRESNTWLDQIILLEVEESICGEADTDNDSIVDLDELYAFIDRWKNNEVLIGELMATIGEWKYGC